MMPSTGTFIADKSAKHEPLYSIADVGKMEGFATYQTMTQWAKKNKLPRHKAIVVRGRKEVKLYSLDGLKVWHSEVMKTLKFPDRVGRRYEMK